MSADWIHSPAGRTIDDLVFWVSGWHLPEWLLMPLMLLVILGFLSLSALFLIWLERKVSAAIQNRMGPMLTGPRRWRNSFWKGGALQTVADAIKLLLKELIVPGKADAGPFILAPMLVFSVCVSAYVAIPFAPALAVSDLNIGLLYIVSISSLTVLSILMAGWSSNNKYSLLGGLRSAAQMLSYEIPLLFALLGPIMMAGTLSMQGIVKAQMELGVWFIVPSFLGAVVYYVASIAEVNRPPFDIPEAESELVAGYVSEYSGMMFAMFFLAEFCNMMLVSAVAATVFLGGWAVPFWPMPEAFNWGYTLVGCLIFFIKTYFLISIMMWIRWTFPRIRPDHLMNLGWKFMLPMAFVNLLFCSVVAIFQAVGQSSPWIALAVGVVGVGTVVAFMSLYKFHEATAPSPSAAAEQPA
ncbi:MAG: NADH-quinone oxidoreductase subunit NuoH [Candidatus Eremiobacteraeota bacterium]|nr:NADH-quinone oxidoreductase subunit NuoH [Candidatus Eremiobacteraeota bacterium]